MPVANTRNLSIRLIAALGALSAASCGSGTTSGGPPLPEVAIDRWWETPTPDFSDNPDRPVITLNGSNALFVSVGDVYQDAGAVAVDLQDGDLTAQISVDNPVDTSVAADYVVRFSVADSSQLDAIEAVRVVRVHDGTPTRLSPREIGTTASHLGYVEHLPASYTDVPGQTFPLLIFNHGGGASASLVGEQGATPLQAVSEVARNGGPAMVIDRERWVASDPMIVLSPQTVDLEYDDPVERLNAFVDFAIATYNVDTSRIYISGWSAGASLSLAYAVLHADRVAAVAPLAAGLHLTNDVIFPDGFCAIEDVPMWAFHGENDAVLPPMVSIDNQESIINTCTPLVTPRLTIFLGASHNIPLGTYNLTMMETSPVGVKGDPAYDLYDITIFDWLLSHSLQNRGL